ncbi:fructose-bisphosphate aldolase class I [Candidatus Kaiserbacteria bacterium]|nr:fructose-bisphosphate aldolase class I [Candidatus Kaiserbacteria bacterium]
MVLREIQDLKHTVSQLMHSGKGILAADESDKTAGKRLAMVDLPNEPDHRRAFRELLFTAPDIEEYISGVILYDSSIKNTTTDGVPFPDLLAARGIVPGIKVDMGIRDLPGFPGETVTKGLDALDERFAEYYKLGARFAKWRAVVTIGEEIPTDAALRINAVTLAEYAALAQASGIVPVVEPEVLFQGDHSIVRAEEVTIRTLQILFDTLRTYRVDLSGTILKTSMVLAGDSNTAVSSPEEVAGATLRTLHLSVPHDVGGIVFLSGGQTPVRATENLNAIAKLGSQPWPISSSYSRALEEPVLVAWQGKDDNIPLAQKALLYRAKMNGLAQQGKYEAKRDKQRDKKNIATDSQD